MYRIEVGPEPYIQQTIPRCGASRKNCESPLSYTRAYVAQTAASAYHSKRLSQVWHLRITADRCSTYAHDVRCMHRGQQATQQKVRGGHTSSISRRVRSSDGDNRLSSAASRRRRPSISLLLPPRPLLSPYAVGVRQALRRSSSEQRRLRLCRLLLGRTSAFVVVVGAGAATVAGPGYHIQDEQSAACARHTVRMSFPTALFSRWCWARWSRGQVGYQEHVLSYTYNSTVLILTRNGILANGCSPEQRWLHVCKKYSIYKR